MLAAFAAAFLFAATPPEDVSQERLLATLRELPAPRAALGDAQSREHLIETEELIRARLILLGYDLVIHDFKWSLPARNWNKADTPATAKPSATTPESDTPPTAAPAPEPHTYHNIILDLPGDTHPHDIIIVSAHYDAVPTSKGADDDGTGVAALLEVARVLKGVPHDRTIRLIFFNLEECGLGGSVAYVKTLRADGVIPSSKSQPAKDEAPKPDEAKADPAAPAPSPAGSPDRIRGMLSLDMLGYFSDAPNSQKSPIPPIKGVFEPPTVGDGIALVGFKRDEAFLRTLETGLKQGASPLKVFAFAFPVPIPDALRSDHQPFYLAGIPAAMLTDTANLRNPHYHTAGDTIDTLDMARFTQTVRGVVAAALAAAAEKQ